MIRIIDYFTTAAVAATIVADCLSYGLPYTHNFACFYAAIAALGVIGMPYEKTGKGITHACAAWFSWTCSICEIVACAATGHFVLATVFMFSALTIQAYREKFAVRKSTLPTDGVPRSARP